jgi:signal transduction histidine kinase/DNA-binding XRE family transcriptional regulator
LSSATDYDAMLARFAQLVVDSGFADECRVEACVSAVGEGEGAGPMPTSSPSGVPRVVRSRMRVPLVVRGALVGAMSLTRFETSRGFAEADRELGEALAWCAALIVDNASLVAAARVARESAERATRAKDEFLSLASHELRTPLTAVLGWARMLLTCDLDSHRRHRAVEAIERNARAEARLVDELLEVGVILSGDRPVRRDPMLPVAVVERAFGSVSDAARARDVHLELVTASDPGSVVGDSEQLQRLVTCLLDEAIKVSPRGGRATVRVGRAGEDLEISLEDGGERQPSLARVLFDGRPRERTSRAFGASMGLALARRLVELQAGTIRVKSAGRGNAEQLVVRVPATRDDERSASSPSSREEPHQVSGEALRRARQEHGWTQPELAAAAGLSPDDVELLESDALAVSLPVARRICAALNVGIDALKPRDPDQESATRSGLHFRLRPGDDSDANAMRR